MKKNNILLEFSYKILKPNETHLFITSGVFHGTDKDKQNGFIHLCKNFQQLRRIIYKNYEKQTIDIFQIHNSKLKYVKFEDKYGDIYPHMYEPLCKHHISKAFRFIYNKNYDNKISRLEEYFN